MTRRNGLPFYDNLVTIGASASACNILMREKAKTVAVTVSPGAAVGRAVAATVSKKTADGWLVGEKIVLLRRIKFSPIMDDYYAETINV